MSAYEDIKEIERYLCSCIDGFSTVGIGLERPIPPSDYPILRLVPASVEQINPSAGVGRITLLVHFGDHFPISKSPREHTEQANRWILDMDERIRAALLGMQCRRKITFVETAFDQDTAGTGETRRNLSGNMGYKIAVSAYTIT